MLREIIPPASTNQKVAATGVGHIDGEGEPDDRWCDRFVQGSLTVRFVEHVVEDEQRLVVAGVDNWADQDGQTD